MKRLPIHPNNGYKKLHARKGIRVVMEQQHSSTLGKKGEKMVILLQNSNAARPVASDDFQKLHIHGYSFSCDTESKLESSTKDP